MTSLPDVETVLPLTPLQQGLLLHSIADPELGVYLNQIVMTITGELAPESLRRSWEETLRRHDALRTAFLWDDLDQPVQAVRGRAPLPWREQDWRQAPAAEQERMLAEQLDRDRAEPFVMARAPLMRLLLVRVGRDRWWLVWTHHHLLVDGWTMSLVLSEVFARYRSAGAQTTPELPPAAPYGDYVQWLYDQDGAAAERFWRGRLAGFPGPTPLPGARVAASGPPAFRESVALLTEAEFSQLRQSCKPYRLTLGTVLHGAWALLLNRYTGRFDVTFGSVVAGRPPGLAGVEGMVGLLSNTLPVRATLTEAAEAADWLVGLQSELAEARQYEYSSLSQVARWAGTAGAANLFDTLVAWENYPVRNPPPADAGGLRVTDIRFHERPHYPLTLSAGADHRLTLRLHADLRWYDEWLPDQLVGQLRGLLCEFAARPRAPLGELVSPAGTERDRVLGSWAAGPPGEPLAATLPAALAAQAARTPDSPAVEVGSAVVSYQELDARVTRLAGRLRDLGAAPEEPVAVCLDRPAELAVALFGVARAGAVVVPIDPGHPRARIATLLTSSGSRIVVTSGEFAAKVPEADRRVVVSLDDLDPPAGAGAESDSPPPGPDTALFLVHTTGGTAAPRSVLVTHRGVLNQLSWRQRRSPIGPGDRVVHSGPVRFDQLVRQVCWPLVTGGCLRAPGGDRPAEPPPVGGAGPDAEVLADGYGAPEVSGLALVAPAAGEASDRPAPAGRPVDNARCYVLDHRLRPVPVGVPGELYVAGAGLARGYLGSRAATADRFVPDPYGPAGGRAYRTGELARWRPDGTLEPLGRPVVRAAPAAPVTPAEPAAPEREYVAPTTDAERTLAGIWAQVLGLDRVGVHDNFFELGGDSIMSLLVVSRAARAGLRITARQFLDHQTVAGLAAVAEPSAEPVAASAPEDREQVRRVALTPIQHWFFAQQFPRPEHWNLGVALRLAPDPDRPRDPARLADLLRPVFAAMVARHDALRTRFRSDPDRGWTAEVVPAGELALGELVSWVSLRDRPDWEPALAEVARAAQEFPLDTPPLLRAVLVDGGRDDRLRLLLNAHHLVVDGVSWRVLLEDLRLGYQQAVAGRPVRLPTATTSNAAWAEALAELAVRPELVGDLDFWLAQPGADGGLPVEVPGAPPQAVEAEVRHVHTTLSVDETGQLLRDLPRTYHTYVDDALLAALGRALVGRMGVRELVMALEAHGREQELVNQADLSGTVGWLTAMAPVRLTFSPPDEQPSRSLVAMKEQLRAVPRRGLSYGLLRYLHPTLGPRLAELPEPTVSFNNLGQFDLGRPPAAGAGRPPGELALAAAPEEQPPAHHPANHRPHLLDISSVTVGGQLRLTFSYSPAHHTEATVRGLAEETADQLRALIAHSGELDRPIYTPSDFPESGLDQDQLDRLLADVDP